MTAFARRLVDARWFDPLILVVIVINAIALGAETYEGVQASYGAELKTINDVVLGIFVLELALRLTASRHDLRGFFRNGWNLFDVFVVVASFTPGLRENATLLRLIRLLRVVRAIRLLPDLRILTVAVARSLPGVASLAAISLLLVYVYGMIGWLIFDEHDPQNFADVGQAMITMFVLLTLENLPTYIEKGLELSDWTLLFYGSYVLLASFLIFNLFIGIVINSMEEARAIELRRAEKELLDGDPSNDEAAHQVVIEERLRAIKHAVEELEGELRAHRR